jgi:nicotinamide-nucleotide amidase
MVESRFCIDAGLIEQATALIELLRVTRISVVTVESCTGGLIAAALARAPGASDCLYGGFAALARARAPLGQSGSVSADVAGRLAVRALERTPANIAIGVTGVLGSQPDEDGNPPGRVYFGLLRRGHNPHVLTQHFSLEDPHRLRRAVVLRAMALLRETVQF